MIAAGPSLMLPDVDYVRGRVTATIAVNESWRMAPWADVLYGCDADKFWRWNKGVPDFHGLKYAMRKGNHLAQKVAAQYGLAQLRNAGDSGLSLDPSGIMHRPKLGVSGDQSGGPSRGTAHHSARPGYADGREGQAPLWHKNHPDGSQPPFQVVPATVPHHRGTAQSAGHRSHQLLGQNRVNGVSLSSLARCAPVIAPVCYSVPNEYTSPRFCAAFAAGCGGTVTSSHKLRPGPVALFGSAKLWPLLKQAQAAGREWLYGDHGYFGRYRYYRITRNALSA